MKRTSHTSSNSQPNQDVPLNSALVVNNDRSPKESDKDVIYLNFSKKNCSDPEAITRTLQKKALHFIYCNHSDFSIEFGNSQELRCKPFYVSFLQNQSDEDIPLRVASIIDQHIAILSIDIKSLKNNSKNPIEKSLKQYWKKDTCTISYAENFYYDKQIANKIDSINKYKLHQNFDVLQYAFIQELKYAYIQHFLIYQYNSNPNHLVYEEIAKIPEIISKNLGKKLSEESLVRLTGMEIEKISVGCKDIFKCDIPTLIEKVKLHNITKLMKNPNLTIADIAYQNGFTTRSAFYELFYNAFSCAPVEYRELIRAL
ncbi:helix-turn-helix domain-containing protein [Aquimarina sp. M1]